MLNILCNFSVDITSKSKASFKGVNLETLDTGPRATKRFILFLQYSLIVPNAKKTTAVP